MTGIATNNKRLPSKISNVSQENLCVSGKIASELVIENPSSE